MQQTKEAIQDQIIRHNPIVVGVVVYNSFYQAGKTGRMPMPSKFEKPLGGHALLVVGYDQSGVLIRNSWGQDWGIQPVGAKTKGYFWMPWEYILNSDYAYDF